MRVILFCKRIAFFLLNYVSFLLLPAYRIKIDYFDKLGAILRSLLVKKYLESKGAVVGDNFLVGQKCMFRIQDGCRIKIGDNVVIGDLVLLNVRSGAVLVIGKGSHINFGSRVSCFGAVSIGCNTLIASYCNVLDHDHCFDLKSPPSSAKFVSEPIKIGDGVWMGTKVQVGKGVSIGDFSVIGAHSVVTKSVKSSSVYAGVPARMIRTLHE